MTPEFRAACEELRDARTGDIIPVLKARHARELADMLIFLGELMEASE